MVLIPVTELVTNIVYKLVYMIVYKAVYKQNDPKSNSKIIK